MAFADNIVKREVSRLRQQKTVFLPFTNQDASVEILGKVAIAYFPVMTNITLAASAISGTSGTTIGTGPGQAITNSPTTFSVEPLKLEKYAPYRTTFTDFDIKHSKVPLEMSLADNLTTAEGVIIDNYVRDVILVDKVATIPAANKVNSGAPITLSTSNVIAAFSDLVVALDKQNTPQEGRVLFISPAAAGIFFQANLFASTDSGLDQIQKGYLGSYRGVKILQTNALTASNEMIMMATGAVHFAFETYALETVGATDGKYNNFIYELVYGGTVLTTNATNIAINYCV